MFISPGSLAHFSAIDGSLDEVDVGDVASVVKVDVTSIVEVEVAEGGGASVVEAVEAVEAVEESDGVEKSMDMGVIKTSNDGMDTDVGKDMDVESCSMR